MNLRLRSRSLSVAFAAAGFATTWLAPARAQVPPIRGETQTAPAEGSSGRPVRYTLQGIEVRGNHHTDAYTVRRLVPFADGEIFEIEDQRIELTRIRLLGTGYFSRVTLSLRRGDQRGWAFLVIEVVERNTLLISDYALGATAAPGGPLDPALRIVPYGGITVSELNLLGRGLALSGSLAGGADGQVGVRMRLGDSDLFGSGYSLESGFLFNNAHDGLGNGSVQIPGLPPGRYAVFAPLDYRRFGGAITGGRELSLNTRVQLGYRFEWIEADFPAGASHSRGADIEPVHFDLVRGGSRLSALSFTIIDDTRDDPFLPSTGRLWWFNAGAAFSAIGSSYDFGKMQFRAEGYRLLSWRHVLRLDAFVGVIVGDAPLFEKFFVGDLSDLVPSRLLELSFDRRPPPNVFGTSIVEMRYEQLALRVGFEYSIPLVRHRGFFYGLDLFASTGLIALGSLRDIAAPPTGYPGLSAFPIDLTFNFGLRANTRIGFLRLSFEDVLALFPYRRP